MWPVESRLGRDTMKLTLTNPVQSWPTSVLSGEDSFDLRLPNMKPVPRLVCRSFLKFYGRQVLAVEGAEHISAGCDPFILALNHSQKREAILIPAVLAALREGRQVHFMADWNFLMIPLIGFIIRCNEPIIVDRKSARPQFLNFLKPWLASRVPVLEQARQRIREGRSIGIFPEATVNRDPRRLLRGLNGAAQLSLELGVPVIPAGVRFPEQPPGAPIRESARFTIHFGQPLRPSAREQHSIMAVRGWHAEIMGAIARLSGKEWFPDNRRIKYAI